MMNETFIMDEDWEVLDQQVACCGLGLACCTTSCCKQRRSNLLISVWLGDSQPSAQTDSLSQSAFLPTPPSKRSYAQIVKGAMASSPPVDVQSSSIDRKNHTISSASLYSSSSPGYSSEFATLLMQNLSLSEQKQHGEQEEKEEEEQEEEVQPVKQPKQKIVLRPKPKMKITQGWQKIDATPEET